jgi:hypothetical protein
MEQESDTRWILMGLSELRRAVAQSHIYRVPHLKTKYRSTVNIWRTVNPEPITYLGYGPLD